MDSLTGTPIVESRSVERGKMYKLAGMIVVHPSTMMWARHGHLSILSRRTLGQRELERDRRKYS